MIEWITANGTNLVELIMQIVGTFAIVATMTPNTADNKIASVLLEAVNFLGGNLGKARNSPDA